MGQCCEAYEVWISECRMKRTQWWRHGPANTIIRNLASVSLKLCWYFLEPSSNKTLSCPGRCLCECLSETPQPGTHPPDGYVPRGYLMNLKIMVEMEITQLRLHIRGPVAVLFPFLLFFTCSQVVHSSNITVFSPRRKHAIHSFALTWSSDRYTNKILPWNLSIVYPEIHTLSSPPNKSKMLSSLVLFNSIGLAFGGTVLWDGRFNDMTSSSALNDWSWSNQAGPYQYYIVGVPLYSYCDWILQSNLARYWKCDLLRQPRFHLQEPSRHQQQPRCKNHIGQHLVLEWANNEKNRTHPPNHNSHRLRNCLLPFLHATFKHQCSQRISWTPNCLLRKPFHRDESWLDQWRIRN